MIYERAQAEQLEVPAASDALHYAGLLSALRGLTVVTMLAVLMALAGAGLRPLPWTEPMPGWLLVLYFFGAAAIYLATYLTPTDRSTMVSIGLLFDLGMLVAISLFSGGALAPFALLPVLALAINRNVWAGLLAAVAFAAHLPLAWPPLGSLATLPTAMQMFLGGLMLLVLVCWTGIAAAGNSQLARETVECAKGSERVSDARYRKMRLSAKSLYNISSILTTSGSTASLSSSIFEELRHAVPLDAGMVMLLDSVTGRLRIAGSHGLSKQEQEASAELRGGAIGRAIAQGAPSLLAQLATEPDLLESWPRLAGFSAALVVPLRLRYELFGVIIIFRQAGQYDRDETELLGAIGSSAVVALQNAQLQQTLHEERERMVSKEDDVRRQLARDLHDGPGQSMAMVAMKTEFIKKLLDLSPHSAMRELDDLGQTARKANREVRSLLFELRPAILESHGLVAALASYAQRSSQNATPVIHFGGEQLPVRLAPKVETTVFNVVQEAVANARAHSRARNVWVSLRYLGNRVMVTVQDDGQGFDVAAQQEGAPRRGGFGLLNMRERTTAVDGQLAISSEQGRGTTVTLEVPA